jgi:protein translocase SecG subunit
MTTFLTALQIFCSLLIVALVLLQPAKQGAGAFASTQGGPMGNAAGSTPLFKITMFLAGFVMLASIIVSRSKIQEAKISAVDDLKVTELKKTEAEPVTDLTQAPAKSTATPSTNSTTTAPSAAPLTAPKAAPTAPTTAAPAPKATTSAKPTEAPAKTRSK